jgi:hypothetical protein
MQETGVQTIAWEAEGWRLWGVQEILKEYRRIFRSSGEILKEFRSCRSTGVQTIAWETEGWRLWGVQEILKEFRRIFRSSGVAGVQEFRQ